MLKQVVCLVFLFGLFAESSSMPLHASCKIEWNWPETSCTEIQAAVVAQIQQWNNSVCGHSEKCLYELESNTLGKMTAKHTTPVKRYVDDLSFTFNSQDKGCIGEGKSRSETWYAVLDYGTNYCNLENLITGSGLNKQTGYTETTSDSVCTQYSSANCEKY